MNVTVLNGASSDNYPFNNYLTKILEQLSDNVQHQVFHLSDKNIQSCTGCWNCWWRTPGKCIIHDDMDEILQAVIQAEMVLFCAPLVAGFPSFKIKMVMDRMIPLVHPYIILKNKECHHRKRYDNYPDIGLILQKEEDTTSEDLIIVEDIFKRVALNFHSSLRFTKIYEHHTSESIAHEISHI